MAQLKIQHLQLGSYGTNAYVVTCATTGKTVLVDTPGKPADILAALAGVTPEYILITHGHMDHLEALAGVKEATKAPVAAHAGDARRLPFSSDRLLEDGDTVQVGQVALRVIHSPGHTPGSICFFTDGHLLSGDTLFPNGPGKTATPQDFRQVVDSIVSKLFILPDDTQVYSGHGDATVLGREKEYFAAFNRGPQDPNLCGDVLWVPES